MSAPKIVVVAGPTATGTTRLGLLLAQALGADQLAHIVGKRPVSVEHALLLLPERGFKTVCVRVQKDLGQIIRCFHLTPLDILIQLW